MDEIESVEMEQREMKVVGIDFEIGLDMDFGIDRDFGIDWDFEIDWDVGHYLIDS